MALVAIEGCGDGRPPSHPNAPRTMEMAIPMTSLPRVTRETWEQISMQVDETGPQKFTMAVIEELERDNPELLAMVDKFAEGCADYLETVMGFAMFYRLITQQLDSAKLRLN
jgi:hypothetical protein